MTYNDCPKCGGKWGKKSGFWTCSSCGHVHGSECSDGSYRNGRVFYPGADDQTRPPKFRRTPESHRSDLEFE